MYSLKQNCENGVKYTFPRRRAAEHAAKSQANGSGEYSTLSRVSPFAGIVLPTSERSPSVREQLTSSKDMRPSPRYNNVPAIVRTMLYKKPPPQTVKKMSSDPREKPVATSAEYTVRTVVFV